jgi:ATPase subunit of ABC transporter with duplicated ATPase domains
MMMLLQLERLVAGWQRPAHRPLSFALARGDILALAGPNGAGKSTLLAALAGGGARVFSGSLWRAPALRIGVQMQHLPPMAGLPLSGAELLALTGEACPQDLPTWLAACLPRRLDELSGGQRQYLALHSILQAPADLLLLDEPGNHLDKAGLASLPAALRARAARGAGIVLVSHDTALAEECCDRLIDVEPCDD